MTRNKLSKVLQNILKFDLLDFHLERVYKQMIMNSELSVSFIRALKLVLLDLNLDRMREHICLVL